MRGVWCAVPTALAVLLTGCGPNTTTRAAPAPEPTAVTTQAATPTASAIPTASPTPTASAAPTASPTPRAAPDAITFTWVVDGDTIQTSAGTVRLIGVDTPERGECGHDEASQAIGRLVSRGDVVTLELPPGQNDTDRYGRLIRYVTTSAGVDLGLMQLQAGNAIARYDSTDGYPRHPREAAYHAAQLARPGSDGSVVTTSCADSAPPAIVPAADTDAGSDAWWTKYSSCTKLKKNTVGDPTGPFRRDDPDEAAIYEWFESGTGNNGDGDDDGLACE